MIQFVIDGNKLGDTLTWEDMEAIDTRSKAGMRVIMAKFVVDESGQPVAYDTAFAMLGKLTLNEMGENIDHFVRVFKGLAVNPTIGNGSSVPLPTEAVPRSGGSNSAPQEVGIASPGNSAESIPLPTPSTSG